MTEEQKALLRAFADDVRHHRDPPDDLLARLHACLDDDLADALLDVVARLAADLPAVRCGAGAVHRLVRLPTDPDTAAALRTGADFELGRAAVVAECWDEAVPALTRARSMLDGLEPDDALCDLLLAEALDGVGRRAEAVSHWTAARDGLRAAGEMEGAGNAAMLLAWAAADDGARGPGVENGYAEAAELFAAAGADEQATECARRAGHLVRERIEETGDGAAATILELAVGTHALAERHGARGAAVDMALCVVIYGSDAGWEWARVRRWCDAARRSVDAGVTDPPAAPWRRATIDLAEGATAAGRGLPTEAEAALRRALAAFRDLGSAVGEDWCLSALASLRGFTEQADPGRVELLTAGREWADPDRRSATTAMRAVLALQSGAPDTDTLFGAARAAATDAGPDAGFRAVLLDLMAAFASRDDRTLRAALGRADEFLRSGAGTLSPGIVRSVRFVRDLAELPVVGREHGTRAAADATLAVETRLLESGAGLLAAQTAIARAGILLDDGAAAEALDVALPAALALDAVRFHLDGADRRHRWNAVVARGFAIAFRSAVLCREHRLLAELLEVGRGNGTPVVEDGPGDPVAELLAAADAAPEITRTAGTALAGAAAVSGAASRTTLQPPARIRAPWGTVALEDALLRARRYHDPVRAAEIVDWAPEAAR